MCILCGNPALVHGQEFPVAAAAGDSGSVGTSSGGVGAAALSPGAQTEVTYLTGVTAGGTIAATSFWTWNYNNPATYSSTSWAAKWGNTTPGTTGGTVTYWFDAASAWTATEKAALASGLALWSAVANINFALASSAATANFIFYEGTDGSAYESGNSWGTPVGSTVTGGFYSTGTLISIDTDVAGFGPIGASFGTYGGYPYQTLLHEIGHLIGLGHGGGYNGNVNAATQQFSAYDTRLWTIMSYIDPSTTSAKYYSSYPVTGTNWGISADGYYNVPTTMMILDIVAAQELYGTPTSGPLTGGNHVFGFNSNLAASIKSFYDFTVNTNPIVTIWASGTDNTLDLSGWSNPATINLNPGTFSSAHGQTNNIGIAEGAVIDKAIGGSGNDTIIGNALDNVLTGNGGNDTFTGGAGTDVIYGGSGTDTANFSGAVGSYTFEYSSLYSLWVVSGGSDGTDLAQVETYHFTDATGTAAASASEATLTMALGDGTSWTHHVDLDNSQTWTQYTNYYSGSAIQSTQTGSYDAGGSWFAAFDVHATETWTSYTSNYNAAGNQVLQVGNYDNGNHWVHSFDADSTENFTDYVINYDANWVRQLQVGNYDNGNHWIEHEDSTGTKSWTSYTTNYDPAWNPTMEVGNYDNGNHWVTTWDSSNNGSFTTHIYESNWALIG